MEGYALPAGIAPRALSCLLRGTLFRTRAQLYLLRNARRIPDGIDGKTIERTAALFGQGASVAHSHDFGIHLARLRAGIPRGRAPPFIAGITPLDSLSVSREF